MADEFDQYKVSSGSEDEFAQYKVAPAITPPSAAGPHIDMQYSTVGELYNPQSVPKEYRQKQLSGPMPGSFEGHPENIGEYVPASAGQLASGVGDIAQGDIARGGHKVISGVSNALLPAAPFAATAAPAVMLRALIGGALGGAVASKGTQIVGGSPDQQQFAGDIGNLIGGYGGVKSSAIANRALPLAGVAAQDAISRIPYVGRAVRRPSIIDYIEALSKSPEASPKPSVIPPSDVYRSGFRTPRAYYGGQPPEPIPAQSGLLLNGYVPRGTLSPKPIYGPRAPTYQVNPSQGTPLPSVLEGQNPVNMRTTYPPEPTPPVSKPARPAPTWQTNPSEGTEIKVQGSTAEDIKAQLQRMANRPRTPVQPPTDPWANLKFDKAAQEQARTELGAHADTTRVLERAQEIKTQMMQQGSQYQVVKVGTLPKAKGNPFSGPNTPSVMEPAQSTNISLHGYHPESQTMVVQFKNGNVYSYKGVPQEIFDNYRNSESQGSFFANNIKGRYQTELRGTVKPTPGVRVKQALGGQP